MELFKNFGIEPIILIAQIVNFLIILYLLKRFAYNPILNILKKREDTIKMGLKQAEESKLLLEKASDKEQAILKKAQSEARALQEEAINRAESLSRKIENETKKKADSILKEAKEKIEEEARETEKRLQVYTTELAISILKKASVELFTQKEQNEVLQKALKKIKPISKK